MQVSGWILEGLVGVGVEAEGCIKEQRLRMAILVQQAWELVGWQVRVTWEEGEELGFTLAVLEVENELEVHLRFGLLSVVSFYFIQSNH